MESYILDWFNLFFRWFHLTTGAAWIGTSFYFNWLNHSLRPPETEKEGIKGELFAVHGGAFYQVLKYDGAPKVLPKTLHWFKWEAYFTWITGICLLTVVYYWDTKVYLLQSTGDGLQPWQAILTSIGFIVLSWVVYDLMCRSPLQKNPMLLAVIGLTLLTMIAFTLTRIYQPRAAFIHVGVIIGTIMAANVFFVIIPNQRLMVDAMIAGQAPDVSKGEAGAMRSLHNNYLTLPVLFIMLSNHYPMVFGNTYNWAMLAGLALISMGARHYFNLKHNGEHKVWILPVAAVSLFALAVISKPRAATPSHTTSRPSKTASKVTFKQIQPILQVRCLVCHASKPSFPGFNAPPQGIKLERFEQVRAVHAKIRTSTVNSQYMPLGNLTKITPEERALIGEWIAQGMAKE
ncbi:MAG: urate hydroxylase PuuD [Myxococcales bacterium]|nr:urate hydroxylase PuuD [Myxococcales bacterium]MCB9642325.1 urate hydroxylase PuuD [Myxococcales bacterium]